MILSTTRIKASSGGRGLWNHLQKTAENEQIHVLAGDQASLDDWVADARAAGVKYGVRHVSISPDREMSRDQALDAARLWAEEFGADPQQLVIVEHQKRRVGADEPTRHWHIAAPEYDPAERRVMDSSWNYVRNEVVARQIEHQLGHDITPGRHSGAVVEILRQRGLDDVAAALDQARGAERPTAAYSKRQHQRAKREGHNLAEIRQAVQAAWASSDNADALRSALAEKGLQVVQGERQWIVRDADTHDELGALTRLTKQKKADVEARMSTPAAATKEVQHEPAAQRSADRPDRGRAAADRSESRPDRDQAQPADRGAAEPDAGAGGRERRGQDRPDPRQAHGDQPRQLAESRGAQRDRQHAARAEEQSPFARGRAALRRLLTRSRLRTALRGLDWSEGTPKPSAEHQAEPEQRSGGAKFGGRGGQDLEL